MTAPPDLPALRVLVVDDDEDNRRILCRFLPSPPLDVTSAADGRAALDAAAARPFDVILLDLEMPVMDGFEAAARLREQERGGARSRCVIVGLSAHTDVATRERSLAAGCDRYLSKPVSRAELLRLLRDAGAVPACAPTQPSVEVTAADPVAVDPDLSGVVPEFLASRDAALAELEALLGAGERRSLRRLAHRLAGSFSLYGFRWAADQCQRVERDAEHGENSDLAGMLAALRRHVESVELRGAARPVTKGGTGDGPARATAGRG